MKAALMAQMTFTPSGLWPGFIAFKGLRSAIPKGSAAISKTSPSSVLMPSAIDSVAVPN
jgi:hypothetical protein